MSDPFNYATTTINKLQKKGGHKKRRRGLSYTGIEQLQFKDLAENTKSSRSSIASHTRRHSEFSSTNLMENEEFKKNLEEFRGSSIQQFLPFNLASPEDEEDPADQIPDEAAETDQKSDEEVKAPPPADEPDSDSDDAVTPLGESPRSDDEMGNLAFVVEPVDNLMTRDDSVLLRSPNHLDAGNRTTSSSRAKTPEPAPSPRRSTKQRLDTDHGHRANPYLSQPMTEPPDGSHLTLLLCNVSSSEQKPVALTTQYIQSKTLNDRIVQTAIHDNDGWIVRTQNPVFFAVFTEADAAIKCAVQITWGLKLHAPRNLPAPKPKLIVHSATVTNDQLRRVVLPDGEVEFKGPAFDDAHAMLARIRGGKIWISEATETLTPTLGRFLEDNSLDQLELEDRETGGQMKMQQLAGVEAAAPKFGFKMRNIAKQNDTLSTRNTVMFGRPGGVTLPPSPKSGEAALSDMSAGNREEEQASPKKSMTADSLANPLESLPPQLSNTLIDPDLLKLSEEQTRDSAPTPKEAGFFHSRRLPSFGIVKEQPQQANKIERFQSQTKLEGVGEDPDEEMVMTFQEENIPEGSPDEENNPDFAWAGDDEQLDVSKDTKVSFYRQTRRKTLDAELQEMDGLAELVAKDAIVPGDDLYNPPPDTLLSPTQNSGFAVTSDNLDPAAVSPPSDDDDDVISDMEDADGNRISGAQAPAPVEVATTPRSPFEPDSLAKEKTDNDFLALFENDLQNEEQLTKEKVIEQFDVLPKNPGAVTTPLPTAESPRSKPENPFADPNVAPDSSMGDNPRDDDPFAEPDKSIFPDAPPREWDCLRCGNTVVGTDTCGDCGYVKPPTSSDPSFPGSSSAPFPDARSDRSNSIIGAPRETKRSKRKELKRRLSKYSEQQDTQPDFLTPQETLQRLATAISANEYLMALLPAPPSPSRQKKRRMQPGDLPDEIAQASFSASKLGPAIDTDIFGDVVEDFAPSREVAHARDFSNLHEMSHFFDHLKNINDQNQTKDTQAAVEYLTKAIEFKNDHKAAKDEMDTRLQRFKDDCMELIYYMTKEKLRKLEEMQEVEVAPGVRVVPDDRELKKIHRQLVVTQKEIDRMRERLVSEPRGFTNTGMSVKTDDTEETDFEPTLESGKLSTAFRLIARKFNDILYLENSRVRIFTEHLEEMHGKLEQKNTELQGAIDKITEQHRQLDETKATLEAQVVNLHAKLAAQVRAGEDLEFNDIGEANFDDDVASRRPSQPSNFNPFATKDPSPRNGGAVKSREQELLTQLSLVGAQAERHRAMAASLQEKVNILKSTVAEIQRMHPHLPITRVLQERTRSLEESMTTLEKNAFGLPAGADRTFSAQSMLSELPGAGSYRQEEDRSFSKQSILSDLPPAVNQSIMSELPPAVADSRKVSAAIPTLPYTSYRHDPQRPPQGTIELNDPHLGMRERSRTQSGVADGPFSAAADRTMSTQSILSQLPPATEPTSPDRGWSKPGSPGKLGWASTAAKFKKPGTSKRMQRNLSHQSVLSDLPPAVDYHNRDDFQTGLDRVPEEAYESQSEEEKANDSQLTSKRPSQAEALQSIRTELYEARTSKMRLIETTSEEMNCLRQQIGDLQNELVAERALRKKREKKPKSPGRTLGASRVASWLWRTASGSGGTTSGSPPTPTPRRNPVPPRRHRASFASYEQIKELRRQKAEQALVLGAEIDRLRKIIRSGKTDPGTSIP